MKKVSQGTETEISTLRRLKKQKKPPRRSIPAANPVDEAERAAVGDATMKWNEALKNGSSCLVDVSEAVRTCIGIKIKFLDDSFKADEKVELKVMIKNGLAASVPFAGVRIVTENPAYRERLRFEEPADVEPGTIFERSFSFLPDRADVGSKLNVEQVVVSFGRSFRIDVVSSYDEAKNAVTPFLRPSSRHVPGDSSAAGFSDCRRG